MIRAQFKEQNFTFVKPNEMTDEECSPLTVFKGKDAAGHDVIISKWIDEKTGVEVFLTIYGNGMPPVYIGTENPFGEIDKYATPENAEALLEYLKQDQNIIICGPAASGKTALCEFVRLTSTDDSVFFAHNKNGSQTLHDIGVSRKQIKTIVFDGIDYSIENMKSCCDFKPFKEYKLIFTTCRKILAEDCVGFNIINLFQ